MGVRMKTDQVSLIERIRQGDTAAIEQAYDAYFTPVMNFAYYTVYNYETAKDISQEAFLKVISAIKDKKKDVRDFKPYLFQTARNLAIDEVRKSSRRADYPLESIIAEDPSIFADPERAALLTEQRAQVAAATSRLNDNQKTALTLKDIEGWSYKDIGGLLELSTSAVGVLLSRARLKFRREFRLQQIDPDSLSQECKNIFPLMSAVIDGEATEEQRQVLSEHLDACPLCREAMSEMAGASSTLRSLIPLAPVVAVKAALVAKAAAVAGAGAAVAAVGTGLGFFSKMMIGTVISLVAIGAGVGTYIAIKGIPSSPDPCVRVAIPTEGETLTREVDHEGKALVKIILEVDNEPSAVELDIDGQVVHKFEKGPYRYSWETAGEGSHTIKPIALDADGNRYPGTRVTFTLALTEVQADSIAYLKSGDILIASQDGSGEEKITARKDIIDFRPSPDGERMAFVVEGGILFLMDADGSDVRQVTLPEKGSASNPVFHPGGAYLFFSRIRREDFSGTPGDLITMRFERYDIGANKVDLAYTMDIQDHQGVSTFFFDTDGSELYFNLMGSQFPGSQPRMLIMGPPVSDVEFLSGPAYPSSPDTHCLCLVSVSPDGEYVAFNKDSNQPEVGSVRSTWIRPVSGGGETEVAGNDGFCAPGSINNLEFSCSDPSVFYYSIDTGADHGHGGVNLEFFRGIIGDAEVVPTGLKVTDCEQDRGIGHSIWHLIKAGNTGETP